jgi:hypothetical protein
MPQDEQYRDRASHDLRLLSTPALRPDTEVIEEPLAFMGRVRGVFKADVLWKHCCSRKGQGLEPWSPAIGEMQAIDLAS